MRLKSDFIRCLKTHKKFLRRKFKTTVSRNKIPAEISTEMLVDGPVQASGKRCHLLELPLELRMEIYDYVLSDAEAITISSAPVTGHPADVLHHLTFTGRVDGLPLNHEPIASQFYDPSLLSLRNPPTSLVTTDGKSTYTQASRNGLPTNSLLLTNKQICSEVMSESHHLFNSKRLSLFVSYPYGLHVLTRTCPHLLRRARSIHISGFYDESPGRALHAKALRRVILAVLGPEPITQIEKLELRILHHADRQHHVVWDDDRSPYCVTLWNTYLAKINVEIHRNMNLKGTGLFLTASPGPNRSLSTVWRVLPEEKLMDFVIDSNWPAWNAEYQPPPPDGPSM